MVALMTPLRHERIASLLEGMRRKPQGQRFADVVKVCSHYFGAPRQSGSSHVVFAMPWPGDPRVNLQNEKGLAKAYQVRQAIKAIDQIKEEHP